MQKRFPSLMVFALSLGSLLIFASLIGHQPLVRMKSTLGAKRVSKGYDTRSERQHSVLASQAMIVEPEPSIQDTLLFRMTTDKISKRDARGIARRFRGHV